MSSVIFSRRRHPLQSTVFEQIGLGHMTKTTIMFIQDMHEFNQMTSGPLNAHLTPSSKRSPDTKSQYIFKCLYSCTQPQGRTGNQFGLNVVARFENAPHTIWEPSVPNVKWIGAFCSHGSKFNLLQNILRRFPQPNDAADKILLRLVNWAQRYLNDYVGG